MSIERRLTKSGSPAIPFRIDEHGATARVDWDDHLRTLITQVLCTDPGERINRPRFGAGVAHMLFAPLGPEVASAAQLMIQSALQQWLAELVDVLDVSVEVHESTVSVTVTWSRRSQDTSQTTVVRVARP